MGVIKYFLVLLILSSFLFIVSESAMTFKQYKEKFNKRYKNAEEETWRKKLFKASLKRIAKQNKKQHTATYAVNQFSDRSDEELRNLFPSQKNTMKIDQSNKKSPMFSSIPTGPIVNVPMTFDWRSWLNDWPVHDQGTECGSCWAFSGTAVIEALIALRDAERTPIELSKQELVDCGHFELDPETNEWLLADGCKIGSWSDVLYYTSPFEDPPGHGLMEAKYYRPYNGYFQPCERDSIVRTFNPPMHTIDAWKVFDDNMTDWKIMELLLAFGPLHMGIDGLNPNFLDYSGGIIKIEHESIPNPNSGGTDGLPTNHAVVLVGYDQDFDDKTRQHIQYWIVRNSWGKMWGEDGYARIARGNTNQLCFNCQVTVPIIEGVNRGIGKFPLIDTYRIYMRHNFVRVHNFTKTNIHPKKH